ncbi:MAG: hypothetical protein JSS32_04570 [Verrucomicrobia bacterium]|nr:hypothetical protein [Verrucomicrobiota bacterium]
MMPLNLESISNSLSQASRNLYENAGSIYSHTVTAAAYATSFFGSLTGAKRIQVSSQAEKFGEVIQAGLSVKQKIDRHWQKIKPYQPIISTVSIIGKAGWKNFNCRNNKREMDRLAILINVQKGMLDTCKKEVRQLISQTRYDPKTAESRIQTLSSEIEELSKKIGPGSPKSKKLTSPQKRNMALDERTLKCKQKELEQLRKILELLPVIDDFEARLKDLQLQRETRKTDFAYTTMSLLQLPSLLFPHPTSNPWNHAMNFIQRTFSVNLAIKKESVFEVAMGAIASLGTLGSFLEQTGAIHEDNPVSDALIMGAFGVYLIESAITTYNLLTSRCVERLKEKVQEKITAAFK